MGIWSDLKCPTPATIICRTKLNAAKGQTLTAGELCLQEKKTPTNYGNVGHQSSPTRPSEEWEILYCNGDGKGDLGIKHCHCMLKVNAVSTAKAQGCQ